MCGYRSRFHKAQRMAGRDESEIDAALRGTPDGPQLLHLFRASLASTRRARFCGRLVGVTRIQRAAARASEQKRS